MDLSQIQIACLAILFIVLAFYSIVTTRAILSLMDAQRRTSRELLDQQFEIEDLRKQVANIEWDLDAKEDKVEP